MFGKVPPSNIPDPPGSVSISKAGAKQSGACLPCFSIDEGPVVGPEEKPKPWRPNDNAPPVVSEAPCNLQLSHSASVLPMETTRSCRVEAINMCLKNTPSNVNTKGHFKDTSPSITKNSGNPKYPASSPTIHKCSSNPNCPSFSTSKSNVALNGASKSIKNQSFSSLSCLNDEPRDLPKSLKKTLLNREYLTNKEQSGSNKGINGGQCKNSLSVAKSPSSRSSEVIASVTTVRDRLGIDATMEHSSVDDSKRFSTASKTSLNQDSTELCKNETSTSRLPSTFDEESLSTSVDSPMLPAVSTRIETSPPIVSTDFVSSYTSKDGRQNCIAFRPEDMPTELESLPRSYKDREKCRDPWRPTELEGGTSNVGIFSGDTGQDCSTRRRTGASCQALRHAVASLHRLDDFYLEKIGAGFFSEVFKVTHKVTGQVMVLKMNQLPANRPNMLKEVQLMNKLSHPNILRFMGVCVHEGQLHALTEYINGGSLEQLIMARHVPLPHLIRMNLARDVARGMAYLHSRGLFHRDLTSKNVLIKKNEDTGEMNAVVGDFGLAAKIPDPSSGYRLSTVGSPYWISPECLKGQWYDHRSDVFSFGIVVCELIGRVPADPDVLPRSDNFGLDYLAVAEICAAADPPPAFLQLAFNCCTYEPKSRPTFPEIVTSLDSLIASHEEEEEEEEEEEDESKRNNGKRQSVDPALLSGLGGIAREGRGPKRRTTKLRSHSADTRGCDNATPSDKARCHSTRRVAELASRSDPHYRPMTANPFHALGGVKKILGDLFSSCLELPSLEDVRPSVTDGVATGKFKPALNDSIAKILDRKKPNSEPSSPTARKKWEKKVTTKAGAASLFAHPLFRDGCWEPRRRGSCESGFWSCVGEDLSPEPPNRRHASTLSSSAASSLFLLDDHRTSSIYTDSSEDIASLGGGDSSFWDDRLGGIGSSNKTISKIVEYFERKQATGGSLRLGESSLEAAPSRIALLRASLEGTVPLCSISTAQRLVVCEGAVRSKLPLFDKK